MAGDKQFRASALVSCLTRQLRRLARDQSGATMVVTALVMPVLLGVDVLGVVAAHSYMTQRQIQVVAEISADAAANAMIIGASRDEARLFAIDVAERYDFADGVDGRIFVNIPPTSGPRAGNADFVEVIIERTSELPFAEMVGNEPATIHSRAVSGTQNLGG